MRRLSLAVSAMTWWTFVLRLAPYAPHTMIYCALPEWAQRLLGNSQRHQRPPHAASAYMQMYIQFACSFNTLDFVWPWMNLARWSFVNKHALSARMGRPYNLVMAVISIVCLCCKGRLKMFSLMFCATLFIWAESFIDCHPKSDLPFMPDVILWRDAIAVSSCTHAPANG